MCLLSFYLFVVQEMQQLLLQLMKRVSTGNMNLRFQYVIILVYSFVFLSTAWISMVWENKRHCMESGKKKRDLFVGVIHCRFLLHKYLLILHCNCIMCQSRGFIKGRALGKLTFGEDGFAQLIKLSRECFSYEEVQFTKFCLHVKHSCLPA